MVAVRMYEEPVGKQRFIKRKNPRWDRQRPSTRGAGPTDDHGTGDIEIIATGATAGTPGTWTPPGATPRAGVTDMAGVTASPATAWTTGQYVQGSTPGAPGEVTWTGSAWVGGRAP